MPYRPDRFGPCMCGAIDCPSCGPAQGYEYPLRPLDDEPEPPDFQDTEGDGFIEDGGSVPFPPPNNPAIIPPNHENP